jgi:hypothetical protein
LALADAEKAIGADGPKTDGGSAIVVTHSRVDCEAGSDEFRVLAAGFLRLITHRNAGGEKESYRCDRQESAEAKLQRCNGNVPLPSGKVLSGRTSRRLLPSFGKQFV